MFGWASNPNAEISWRCAIKWFKHVSDSLDDPFIVELIDEFGSDAYIVFFGIIEIYSREFSPENQWKLDVTLPFFHRKLHVSPSKIKKILAKIYKWEIFYYDNRVMIYIPKFKELLDNWTVRKLPKEKESLRSNDVETTQPIRIKNKDKRIKNKEYSLEFESFYSLYPNKKDKPEAYKAWQKRNGSRPPIEEVLKAIQKQIEWRDNANGEFRPEWKNPATWLNKGSWTDEISIGESNVEWAKRRQKEIEAEGLKNDNI
jgi:hypothetical protein